MGKKETTRVRRIFTRQFKRDAVQLVHEGKTVSEVARVLMHFKFEGKRLDAMKGKALTAIPLTIG